MLSIDLPGPGSSREADRRARETTCAERKDRYTFEQQVAGGPPLETAFASAAITNIRGPDSIRPIGLVLRIIPSKGLLVVQAVGSGQCHLVDVKGNGGGSDVEDDSFALEGRTYFQQCFERADREDQTGIHPHHALHWYARDVVTAEGYYVGKDLPQDVQTARTVRDTLLPYISATRTRLRDMEKALERLDRGDPLTLADQVAIAACGFGAALVGGCPPEVYQQGECLALDILRAADRSEPRATGAYLRGVDLDGARLAGTDLSGADLRHAKLSGTDLTHANLNEAKLTGADLSEAKLGGAKLQRANLHGANLRQSDLTGVDMRWVDLGEADLRRADLRDADLSGANLGESTLSQANLSRAVLRLTTLRRSDLTEADLSEAYLRGADLTRANLHKANLSSANLSEAILHRTDLIGAVISYEQLAKAKYVTDVILPDGTKHSESRL